MVEPRVLRFLTLNLWGSQPPVGDRMAVVADGLATLAPDVVALQEVHDLPGTPNQARVLASSAGMHHVFAPTIAVRGGHEGLALLSRLPIVAHEARELPGATPHERRILLSAGLDLGDRVLWVHVTHLNYRLHHGREREQQVMAIDEALSAHADSVPQILMGDFNARPESDEIRWMCGLTTLGGRRAVYQDAWGLRHPHEPGWTWSAENPGTALLAFLQPNRRLDYVFVTPERRDGRGRIHTCRLAFDRPGPGGVYASDHYGVLAEVQIDATPTPPEAR
jgi:endonuclease/exonuclease/phosphatase family metal-dependent hydrolase